MAAVGSRIDEFGDAVVVVVTFSDEVSVAQYLQRHRLKLPILVDSGRAGYRAFGCGRGSVARIWGLRSARRYLQIIRQRGLGALQQPTEDTRQLAGDFIVDTEGTLVFAFWGEGPDDRPTIDELVAALA